MGTTRTGQRSWTRGPETWSFNEDFEEASASTFSLHSEMQLVVHYEERCAFQPTSGYFGCSKKTCLLCETFLHTLPSSIATRGRHGICYLTWGVPDSISGDIEVALWQLETSFVAHIWGFLADLTNPKHKAVAGNIVQSDMVSDFSSFTLEDWQRRDQHVSLFESNETMKQNVSGLSVRQDRITQLATILPTIYIEPMNMGLVFCFNLEPSLKKNIRHFSWYSIVYATIFE